jgi:predicted dehydrogenase
MRIGLVGCGFTADHYLIGLKRYPHLELAAVTDQDPKRASEFAAHQKVNLSPSLEALLSDPSIEMVVNLTNSTSHYQVSKAILEAGKHLYTEKPLAITFAQAQELVQLAEAKGVYFSAAPCSLLGETAQTLWKALRKNEIGKVHVAYGEMEDGPFHLAEPHKWRSGSGAHYDYHEEFKVGVTVEHAGYYLSWFTAFFGPAKTVTGFRALTWPDKQISPEETLNVTTPDFSVACVTFESGVVARLTCSLVGPYNHSMKIVGDKGTLSVHESWNFCAPVFIDRYSSLKFRAERYSVTRDYPFIKHWLDPRPRTYPSVWKSNLKKRQARYRMDYARGIDDVAQAITKKGPLRLPTDYCLHVTELALAIQNATHMPYQVTTTFKPLQPLSEAELKEVIPPTW